MASRHLITVDNSNPAASTGTSADYPITITRQEGERPLPPTLCQLSAGSGSNVLAQDASVHMAQGAAAAQALLQGRAEDPLGAILATGQGVVENAPVERDSPGLSLMEQALTWPVTGPLALPSGNPLILAIR